MEKDLGIEILRHLIEDEKLVNGTQIDITDFVEKHIGFSAKEDVSIESLSAASVISEMVNSGYLTEHRPEERRLYNYGRPQKDHIGEKGNTAIIVGVTWKGKALFHDYGRTTRLAEREWRGFKYLAAVATITMAIALAQLLHSIWFQSNKASAQIHIDKIDQYHATDNCQSPSSRRDTSLVNSHAEKNDTTSLEKKSKQIQAHRTP